MKYNEQNLNELDELVAPLTAKKATIRIYGSDIEFDADDLWIEPTEDGCELCRR